MGSKYLFLKNYLVFLVTSLIRLGERISYRFKNNFFRPLKSNQEELEPRKPRSTDRLRHAIENTKYASYPGMCSSAFHG